MKMMPNIVFKISAVIVAVAVTAVLGWQRFNKKNQKPAPQPSVERFVNQTFVAERQNLTTAVTDKVQLNPALLSLEKSCSGSKQFEFDCYEKYFQDIVANQGIAPAFAQLKSAYISNAYVKSQCHPLTHVIGRVASAKFANVAQAYAQADSFCWSGYHHGVMEGIVGRIGYENVVSQMNGICAELAAKSRYSFDHYNCVHGLGHGVMALTNTELFKSLEMCDQGLKDSWDKSSCYSGVFMENIIVDNKDHFTKYLKPSDPLYPCNTVDNQYRTTCYLMQTSYMLKVTNYDFGKVFALCRQVKEPHKATCLQSLGRDASGNSISNIERTKAICQLGADYFEQSSCLTGAVKDFISYYHSDVQARQLCNAMAEDLHRVCLATVKSYYATF